MANLSQTRSLPERDECASPTLIVEYDHAGRRIAKRVDDNAGSTSDDQERFVYDGEDLTMVYDETGTPALEGRYLHGPGIDTVLAYWQPGQKIRWTLTDRLGSVRDVVEISGTTVSAVKSLRYNSFGQVTGTFGSDPTLEFRYAFTGRIQDADVDLQLNRARWYDPGLGKFLSEDPLGFGAGDSNLTRYVGGDPVNFTDPSGLSAGSHGSIYTPTDPGTVFDGTSASTPFTSSLGSSFNVASNDWTAEFRYQDQIRFMLGQTPMPSLGLSTSSHNSLVPNASALQGISTLQHHNNGANGGPFISDYGRSLEQSMGLPSGSLNQSRGGGSARHGAVQPTSSPGLFDSLVDWGIETLLDVDPATGRILLREMARIGLEGLLTDEIAMSKYYRDFVGDVSVAWKEGNERIRVQSGHSYGADMMLFHSEWMADALPFVADRFLAAHQFEAQLGLDYLIGDFQAVSDASTAFRAATATSTYDWTLGLLVDEQTRFIPFRNLDIAMREARQGAEILDPLAAYNGDTAGFVAAMVLEDLAFGALHGFLTNDAPLFSRIKPISQSMTDFAHEVSDVGERLYAVGGQPYGSKRLGQLEAFLGKRDVRLEVGSKGRTAAFQSHSDGTATMILPANPTSQVVWHELGHFIHWRRVGPEAYLDLPRAFGNNMPEQFVFDLLEHPNRWDRLTPEYREQSVWYIEDYWGGVGR